MKATCAEYTSDTVLLSCPFAKEDMCEVDTAAESKTCMKKVFIPQTCKSYTTKLECDMGFSKPLVFDFPGKCYFDDSQAGGDEASKCLDSPKDCSVNIESACNTIGCAWNW